MVRVIISGASGRMGTRIRELASSDPELEYVGGVDLKKNPAYHIYEKLDDIKREYDCIIDFSLPEVTIMHAKKAAKLKKAIVIGTTGFNEAQIKEIKSLARSIPVFLSPNMSLVVNLFFALIGKASEKLSREYKVRIKEAHHVHKKDKPSGTAKRIAKIVEEKSGRGDIPVESIREGEIIGDHDITFESDVDTLKLSHHAKTRDIFALGALKGAKFLVGKKSGFFSMSDVLGL